MSITRFSLRAAQGCVSFTSPPHVQSRRGAVGIYGVSDSDEKISFWAGAIALPFLMGLMALAMFWQGYVSEHLWNWFAWPFTAIRLSLAEAIGLACLLTMIRARPYVKADGDSWKALIYMFLTPLFALGFGYVAHLYVGHA